MKLKKINNISEMHILGKILKFPSVVNAKKDQFRTDRNIQKEFGIVGLM